MVGETKIICNTLWGKWTCLQGCKTVEGMNTTKKSVDWHGLSIRLRGYSGNTNANYVTPFCLERKGDISRSMECIEVPFQLTSNYFVSEVNIICI